MQALTSLNQVVFGPIGSPKVHFEAPAASRLPDKLTEFLAWFNNRSLPLAPVLKFGIAHLRFVTPGRPSGATAQYRL